MRTLSELLERIKHYNRLRWVYIEGRGYIVWHLSTGDNIEILFIDAPNYGCHLLAAMVRRIMEEREEPFHSVFVCRLGQNTRAEKFYTKMGFHQANLGRSIYRNDDTVLSWIPWDDLLNRLRELKLI